MITTYILDPVWSFASLPLVNKFQCFLIPETINKIKKIHNKNNNNTKILYL